MHFKQLTEEVWVTDTPFMSVTRAEIDALKERAAHNARQRMRICAHPVDTNRLHEMLIVLTGQTYIRPHKHLNKSESLHLIEGQADAVFFDDDGRVAEVVSLGDYASGKPFYYRIAEPRFHTLVVRSECLVFHETTNGPFNRQDTIFAPWAPEESELANRHQFMKELTSSIQPA